MLTEEEVAFAILVAHDEAGYVTRDHEVAKQVLSALREKGHEDADMAILYGGYVVMCPGLGGNLDALMGEVN